MSDLSKESILKRLSNGSVMRGWGAIASFERHHLNVLLRDQFLQGYASGAYIEPMSRSFDLDEGGELRGEFRNLVLGPPQLSFEEATLLSADTTVRLNIISGDYIQHAHLPGSPPIVLRAYPLNEAMGYAISAQAELKLQQSATSRFTHLMLVLSDARTDTLECELGTTPYASKQIGKAVFGHWLTQPSYRQSYVLAQFDREDYSALSPLSAKVLTQMAPWGSKTAKAFKDKAASEGDGAVVVMMQSRTHLLQGTLPPAADDFPYIIPGTAAAGSDYSCTLLLDPVNKGKNGDPLKQVFRPVRMPNAHGYAYRDADKLEPADIVGFGHIAPTADTYRIDPSTATSVALKTLPFTLKGDKPITRWATANLMRASASGTISPAGLYQSGSADTFIADNQISRVTGHYVDASGGEQSRSALLVESSKPVQITPRIMTTSAQPVPILLSASTTDGGTLQWALVDTPEVLRTSRGPARAISSGKRQQPFSYKESLGTLEDLGNGNARFTPKKIEDDIPEILFQMIRVTDSKTKAFSEATVVIVNWPQRFSVQPFYVSSYRSNSVVPFSVASATPPRATWHVFGEGEIDNSGNYTPPQAAKAPVSVVMLDNEGFDTGYAIIEHRPVLAANPSVTNWDELDVFSLEVLSSDKCYANGMQQIEVRIKIETKGNGTAISPPISDAELDSLKLYNVETGRLLEFLPGLEDDEGLEPGTDNWAVSRKRNKVGTRSRTRQVDPLGEESARYARLFLQSTALGLITVAAEFKGDDNVVYRSVDYNLGGSKVDVTAERPPAFKDAYKLTRKPVKGWAGEDPEDFGNVWDTTDYWVLAGEKGDDFQTLKFIRLRFPEERVSMLRWETNQRAEQSCSFTGYSFTPYDPEVSRQEDNPQDPTKELVHDGLLQALTKKQTGSDSYLDTELVQDSKPGSGEVCFALHRVSDLPLIYDEEQQFSEQLRAPLEQPLAVDLMDQSGNWHKLAIKFHLPDKTPGSRDKLAFDVR